MAIMYPEKPKEFCAASLEGEMFNALAKLPDSYHVFHSFSIVTQANGIIYESETDFVVFHPEKGILCIEAKAGAVQYCDGAWRYANGDLMDHDGPYNQASQNKWKMTKYFKQKGLSSILDRCKLLHAVWFPCRSREYVASLSLPSEADISITLTEESLTNIESDISAIFDLEVPKHIQTSLMGKDIELILNRVLAPSFNLVSIAETQHAHTVHVFKTMQKEQLTLLNYLEEQKTAVINGMAGTGKTVMAIEKARRLASMDERVLFLCYNRFLRDHLDVNYNDKNISYYTIDGFACSMCNTMEPNYSLLREALEKAYESESFPYQHIIIDEGQDFGKKEIADNDIVDLLKMNVNDDDVKGGTFYLFYDRNQMIQSAKLPDYIADADCKLTLYRNCRNTENIAITSMRLLGIPKQPKLFEGATNGENPRMYFASDAESTAQAIRDIATNNPEISEEDIRILTCKTESQSILSPMCSDGCFVDNKISIRFTTCRKFKGLESDVIIVVDANKEFLEGGGEKILYVGTSRARHKLYIICDISKEDSIDYLQSAGIKPSSNPYKKLATSFNAKYTN
jgi:hypothetical protein